MALAKVWNDNVHPFSQKFNGELITIPPKSYIEMDFYDAHSFKSKGSPMFKDGMGQQDPKSFKMIRVEGKAPNADAKVLAYKSHVDGSLHLSQEALDEYNSQFDHMRAAQEEKTVNKGGRPRKEA